MGRTGAGVEVFDAFEVLVQVGAGGGIDMHDRADLRVHELLNQAGVEVAGIEGDEADGVGVGGRRGREDERT